MGATLSHKTKSRGRRTGGTYRPMSEINVTPFVDVMLVLLIVFMVAAPLLTAGVRVDLPNSKAPALDVEDNTPIEITLDKDGTLFIGETRVQKERMVAVLSEITRNKDDQRIYVRGDKTLAYGEIMSVIGAINAAGFSKVALVSEQKF